MPFQTFNRPAHGGKRPGAGSSIKEQAAQRLEKKIAQATIEKNAKEIAERFVLRALSDDVDKVLMHAIDKIVPVAKQEIEHSGGIVYEIMTNVDFDK